VHGALLCHEAQNATELGNNYPVIIRKMCRTISSEQKKCRSISSFDKKKAFIVDPFPVGAVDPFPVGVVDPFPVVVSTHFSRPLKNHENDDDL
jgi:hypothetical protein